MDTIVLINGVIMKSGFSFILCTIMMLGLVGCKKTAEQEITVLYQNMTVVFDKTADDLNKSKTGKEAAGVLLSATSKMKKLDEQSKALAEKYPDFSIDKNPELKKEMVNLKESMSKFLKSVSSVGVKYASDKDFEEALKTIGSNM